MKQLFGYIIILIFIFINQIFINASDILDIDSLVVTTLKRTGLQLQSDAFNDFMLRNIEASHRITGLEPNPSSTLQLQSIDSTQLSVFQLKSNIDVDKVVEELKHFDHVINVEPNYPVRVFQVPNDPYFRNQTYLSYQDFLSIWKISDSKPITVAVVDTGIDYYHEELEDNIFKNSREILNGVDDDGNGFIDDIYGYNFYGYSLGKDTANSLDIHGHGTHLAGIIAAKKNNYTGVAGINPNASVLSIRFLDSEGMGTQLDAAMAIRYAVDMGADIINCSWGYFKLNSFLKDAVNYALDSGVVVVAAVGNLNSDIPEYPASIPGVISVGSGDSNIKLESFSSFGTHLDFLAKGKDVYSLFPNDNYGYRSGTSQSCAIISGYVSAMLSRKSSFTVSQVKHVLRQSSTYPDRINDRLGYGFVDLNRLLTNLDMEPLPETTQPSISFAESSSSELLSQFMNYPNPFSKTGTTFGFETLLNNAYVVIKIFDQFGRLVNRLEVYTQKGYNRVFWNGKDKQGRELSNGSYFYVVDISHSLLNKKISGICTKLN
ncbi:hypothetical protein DID75_04315 [Candidatus Marinamargulisbacteria bacterium SCGC AG-410-N11]|nr:hypothetical protein DID75_04315 [Candidatus Marinamargulisbacteria bacterium SCGC AG-410-N11]